MLTVKLCKGRSMKIVEAVDVEISPRGIGKDGLNEFLDDSMRMVTVKRHSGEKEHYLIAYKLPESYADDGQALWDCAYIENAHGSTTEKVAPIEQ